MPVQSSQGKRRPLVPRIDELPDGVPAPARPAAERGADGRLLPGPGTSELARGAARALHEGRHLAQLLGLWEAPEGHAYAPYARLAREWRNEHLAQLSATVGGGRIGPGPASVVSSAAMQMAASRWLYDLGAQLGDAKALLDASRLADTAGSRPQHDIVTKCDEPCRSFANLAWAGTSGDAAGPHGPTQLDYRRRGCTRCATVAVCGDATVLCGRAGGVCKPHDSCNNRHGRHSGCSGREGQHRIKQAQVRAKYSRPRPCITCARCSGFARAFCATGWHRDSRVRTMDRVR